MLLHDFMIELLFLAIQGLYDLQVFNGHYYYFSMTSLDWSNAEAACVSDVGGHLVSIQNGDEDKFVWSECDRRY